MNRNLKAQKIISMFMIFIYLASACGCRITKLIQTSDLPVRDSREYDYILSGKGFRYVLKNAEVTDGYLEARIDTTVNSGGDNRINLYMDSDTLISRGNNNSIKIALDNVSKVVVSKVSPGLTMGIILIPLVTFGVWLYLFSRHPIGELHL
jgi:hypothetical protein